MNEPPRLTVVGIGSRTGLPGRRSATSHEEVGGFDDVHVVDGRNALDPERWRAAGWTYRALGRP